MHNLFVLSVIYQIPNTDPVIETKYATLNVVLSGLVDNVMRHCVLMYYDMYSSC